MPTKKSALEQSGPTRLEVSWKHIWKNLTVRFDGNEIGSIAGQKELKAGQEFSVGDDSTLTRISFLKTQWQRSANLQRQY